MEPFGHRVHDAIAQRGRLCVGIDPHASLLDAWGLDDDAAGLERFVRTVVEALGDRVAMCKPQSAFFERHGAAGIAVLETLVREAREAGALVLLDAKRGDMDSTMQGYAEAYLDQSSTLAVDAITLNPYLGFESLRPMFDMAVANAAGVFVLTLTSNPEGPQFQRARTASGTVAGEILRALRDENAGASPVGSMGAVVGATVTDAAADVDFAINGPLLMPGYGTQGGTPEAMRALAGEAYAYALPSTSRSLLSAGPSVQGLRDAAARCQDELR